MASATRMLGLAKLHRKLKRLPDAARAEIRAAMEATAAEIVAFARRLAPEDDGELRKSIGWTWGAPPKGALTLGKVAASKLGKDLTITVFAGNSEAFYARWIEFGTAAHEQGGRFAGTEHPGTPARPFFYPAYRASRKGAKRQIAAATRRSAKKVAAGG